jgi:hypothetical protein
MPECLLPLSIASIVWFCVNHLVRAETLVLDGQMKVTTQNMVLTAAAQRRGEHRRIINCHSCDKSDPFGFVAGMTVY